MTLCPLHNSDVPEDRPGQRALDLYDNAPVGLWEANMAGTIVAINQTFLDWLGYRRGEVLGRLSLETLVCPEEVPTVRAVLERCRRIGRVEAVALAWHTRDGAELPSEVMALTVYDSQGQLVGWRGSVRDLRTVQAQLQQQLQERTLEATERLASGVAHKFNNLLQVIQGYAELGLITLESSQPVHGHLARIKEAAQRAAALVQGLVAFGRRQAVRRRPLEPQAFLQQLSGQLRRVVPSGVELQLVPGVERARVLADPERLEQVVWQLVANACEAMPHGGTVVLGTQVVRLDAVDYAQHPERRPGTYVCLSVRDTGIGIEPAALGRIFEPFFTTKETSSGLGLAMVWGVVKQHGGYVEVTSQPGSGTTVRLYLPSDDSTVV